MIHKPIIQASSINCQFLSVHQPLHRNKAFKHSSRFRADATEVNAQEEEMYVAKFESKYINSCKFTDESCKNCQPDAVAGSHFIQTSKDTHAQKNNFCLKKSCKIFTLL